MPFELPAGAELVRTTAMFDQDSVPPGLLRAHRIATGVWGRLVVHTGSLLFRFEEETGAPIGVQSGEHLVIPPDVPHHVEVDGPVSFAVEFHRPSGTAGR